MNTYATRKTNGNGRWTSNGVIESHSVEYIEQKDYSMLVLFAGLVMVAAVVALVIVLL